jgi:agmatinase
MNEQINFHGDDVTPSDPKDALFHVIPAPYEETVSYGGGTSKGPNAILEASCQLELFDNKSTPADCGIFTYPEINCDGAVNALTNIKNTVSKTLNLGKIPVLLGGEHTVTNGAVDALIEKYGTDFGVVQFDAHADLRDEYEGSKLSHACVMKRTFDKGVPIYALGTRSYSIEEYNLRQKYNMPYMDAEDIHDNGVDAFEFPEDFPEKVYITFDIDGLDASVMPATGTPVPGGLSWFQAMKLLEKITQQRECVGFDVVEHSPIKSFHGYDFTSAQLVYNIMGYIQRSR